MLFLIYLHFIMIIDVLVMLKCWNNKINSLIMFYHCVMKMINWWNTTLYITIFFYGIRNKFQIVFWKFIFLKSNFLVNLLQAFHINLLLLSIPISSLFFQTIIKLRGFLILLQVNYFFINSLNILSIISFSCSVYNLLSWVRIVNWA
jgi:hypothetical protein